MTAAPPSPPSAKRCLYIAVPFDEARFKVGIADCAAQRWRALRLKVDRTHSTVLEGPALAIRRFEYALKFELDPWWSPLESRSGGFTEWFTRDGLEFAHAALERVLASHTHLGLRRLTWDEIEKSSVHAQGDLSAPGVDVRVARKVAKLAAIRDKIEADANNALTYIDRWEELAEFALDRARGVTTSSYGGLVVGFDDFTKDDVEYMNECLRPAGPIILTNVMGVNFQLGSAFSPPFGELMLQGTKPERLIVGFNEAGESYSLPSAKEAATAINAFYDRFLRRVATMPPVEYRNVMSEVREAHDEAMRKMYEAESSED